MPGVQIDRRQSGDDRIHVGDGHEHFDLVAGQGLGDRQLIEVPRVIVIDRGPEQVPQVADVAVLARGRGFEPGDFGQGIGGEVREQSSFAHGLVGEFLQNGAGLLVGGGHGVPVEWGSNLLNSPNLAEIGGNFNYCSLSALDDRRPSALHHLTAALASLR